MKIIGYTIIICLLVIEIIFYYHNKNENFKNELKKKEVDKEKKEKLDNKKTPNYVNPIENNLLYNKINSEDINSKDINSEDINSKDINSKDINSKDINSKDINSKDIKPWNKISQLNNDFTKYILKINNFNENKLIEWKKIIKNLNYDKNNKNISYITQHEGEALAIANLILSNLNNDIKLEEILDNNLLQISIKKAVNHKLVSSKLRELIETSNNKEINETFDFDIDTYDIEQESKTNKITPYLGKEYSLI
jgi:hypothetical protein